MQHTTYIVYLFKFIYSQKPILLQTNFMFVWILSKIQNFQKTKIANTIIKSYMLNTH